LSPTRSPQWSAPLTIFMVHLRLPAAPHSTTGAPEGLQGDTAPRRPHVCGGLPLGSPQRCRRTQAELDVRRYPLSTRCTARTAPHGPRRQHMWRFTPPRTPA
jgi:hypothetical protein